MKPQREEEIRHNILHGMTSSRDALDLLLEVDKTRLLCRSRDKLLGEYVQEISKLRERILSAENALEILVRTNISDVCKSIAFKTLNKLRGKN